MKSKFLRPLASSLAVCATAALGTHQAHAADITWVGTNTGTWLTTTNWSDGLAPASGNTYTVDGSGKTIIGSGASTTFAGDSLTVKNAAVLRLQRSASNTATFTIPNLTVDAATISPISSGADSFAATLANQVTLANAVTVEMNVPTGSFTNQLIFNNGFTGSGTLSLQRSGTTGTSRNVNINGTNSTSGYSGNVTTSGNISTDTLFLNVNTASGWGTGSLTVNQWSTVTLGAAVSSATSAVNINSNGTLSLGSFDLTAGAITQAGGTVTAGVRTLTGSTLSQSGGAINLTVGGGTDGKLALSGNVDFTGGSIAVTLAGASASSIFDLVTYGGTLTGTPTVNITGDSGRLTPSVNNGSGSNDKVTLSFTGSVGNLTWKGNVDSNWDNNITANFDNGGADNFRFFDNVTFNESATSFTPTLVGTLSAGTLTFSNTTDYLIGGAGSLAGATTIAKSGSGKLTISTANTFTGDISLSEGTLVAGTATAFGGTVVGGGTFVTGTGTVDVNGFNLGAELIRIQGTGVGGNGAIINSGASQTQALRFVTLTGDASIGGANRWDIRGNATAQLTLNNHKLTKIGDNYIALVATTVTSGDIDVNAGTLSFSTTSTVQGSGTVKVNSGGILEIGSGTTAANITRDIVLNGGTISSPSGTNGANSNISLSAASVINNASLLTLNGNFSESGGAHTLTKTGTFALTVTGDGSGRTGETIIDNGLLIVTSNNALGSGKVTIGQTTLGANNHGLRLSGVTIANDVDSQYTWTSDFTGAITAIGGTTSTINGDVTFLPNLPGASNRGSQLASDATAGSVLRLMGELNVGGGLTGIGQRDGVVEYGGGSSTSYGLTVTGTARLAATNGIGSGVRVILGGSGNATFDLNGFSTAVESVTRNASTVSVTNNGASDSVLTVSPSIDRSYEGAIVNGATNKVSLVKEGLFTYTLTGSKTYTGTTTVNGGTLAGTGNSVSALTVQTGAALAPGVSVGTFASETATFDNGSSLLAQLDTSASSADKLVASGNVTIGTGVTLSVADIAGTPAVLTLGTELVLIDYTGFALTGTFNGLAEGAEITVGVNKFLIAYNDTSRVTLTANGAAGGYDSWSAQITNGKTLRTQDADDDGFTNLQEFLFGTNPMVSNGTLVSMTNSGGTLVLRWLQRESGATYTLQESTTLSGWATLVSPVPAVDGDQTGAPSDYDYYKVTLTIGAGRDFFRVQGVEN